MSDGGRGRRLHASLLVAGPRVVPDLIGGEPFAILAWEEWMQRSACLDIDPELFYPSKGDAPRSRTARRICGGCPVRDECLAYAVKHHEVFGIWGGRTPRERRELETS